MESKVRKLKTNAKSPKKVDVHEEPVESMNSDSNSMNSDSNSDGYEMEVESEEESGSQYDTETDTTETEDCGFGLASVNTVCCGLFCIYYLCKFVCKHFLVIHCQSLVQTYEQSQNMLYSCHICYYCSKFAKYANMTTLKLK